MMEKSPEAFKTISEAAAELEVEQHVLRFWETKFQQIKPLKRRGGRRYYRQEDMEVLHRIQHLLYKEGYTIKGAKKALSEKKSAENKPVEVKQAVVPVVEKTAGQLAQPVRKDVAQLDLLPSKAETLPEKHKTALRDILQTLALARKELARL